MASKRSKRRQPDGAEMSGVFPDIGKDKSEAVIVRALNHRQSASESVRSSLNASIDNNMKIEGFRHPSRAIVSQLKDSALYYLIAKSNHKLAGALLRAWVESHPDLRDAVASGLRTVGASPDAPDFKAGRFNSKWDAAEWQSAKDSVASAAGGFDEYEVALMIMCVSGKSHETDDEPGGVESELFLGCIERLDELPPDAPDWDETPAFIDAVANMAVRKSEERREFAVKSIDETAAEIKREFGEELRYLEADLSAWTGENAVEKNAASAAKNLVGELRERLAEYRPLRPQAASRAEEAERGPKRADAEKAILDLVSRWDALESDESGAQPRAAKARADSDMPDPGSKIFAEMMRLRKMKTEINDIRKATDELSSDQTREDVGYILQSQKEMKAQIERLESYNSELKIANSDLKSQNDGIGEENVRLKRENAELAAARRDGADSERDAAKLEAEVERLRADNRRLSNDKEELERDNEGLRSDKEQLGQEKDKLRNDLARSGESEEYWREAYIAVNAGQTRGQMGMSEYADPTSVNEALELAQNMFPNELAIALNSKSSKNSPFRKPEEVLAALSWLATEYHRLRSNPGDTRPDFNKLLKESCPGWFYKPGQTEVTAEQFIEWYTATVDNKTFDLYHHIGKGNSHDPQHTIRIAFAWDDEMERVAVGFLGLHQRNRRS